MEGRQQAEELRCQGPESQVSPLRDVAARDSSPRSALPIL